VDELKTLRASAHTIEPVTVEAGSEVTLLTDVPVMQSEWLLQFELPDSVSYDVGVELGNDLGERYRFGFDGHDGRLYSDRTASGDFSFSAEFPGVHRATRLSPDRRLSLHLFIDAASIEAFVDGGANVLTDTLFPTAAFTTLSVYANGAELRLLQGQAWALSSIWD
jgi:sucrose-6-phosphate hydrolase SacC (GH32 family)